MIISPSNGRIVLYTPAPTDPFPGNDGQRLAAQVCHVWHDRMINVMVVDPNGVPHGRTSVTLVQPGEPIPENGHYCEWMDYQVGQAKKQQPG